MARIGLIQMTSGPDLEQNLELLGTQALKYQG